MRRYLLRFLVVIAVTFTAGGCVSPIGSIGDFKYDAFWVVPKRMTYMLSDGFRPQDDLSAFASFQGAVDSVPINQVSVSISEAPGTPSAIWTTVHSDGLFSFYGGTSGEKGIRVVYTTHTAEYSIMVLGSSDGNGNGNGNGNGYGYGNGDGNSTGVIIDWGGIGQNP
ncbi:MAG: hypothetical protein LBQ69_03085 [Treponema sp.]|nr:hypothetical protein [Treponema sp.]